MDQDNPTTTETPPEIAPEVVDAAQSVWQQISEAVLSLAQPYRLYQILGIVVLVALCWAIGKVLSARYREWLRNRKWSRARLRIALLIDHRIPLMLFVVAAWASVIAIRALTYDHRAAVIEVAATLASVVLGIGIVTRFIANPFLRQIVTWGAWSYAALYYLGLLDSTSALLDSLALQLGDFRMSALDVLKALAVTGVMIAGARMLSQLISGRLGQNEDISPSMRVLVTKISQVVLFSLAVIVGLRAVGFDLTGLAVFSGAVGVGLGFGLQKVVSNLVSGMIILLDKSVKPGDVVTVGDTFGWIDSLGARYVSVVTLDGKEYLIPNEDLVTGQVVNWSHSNEFVRLDLPFGTSYADDPHLVSRVAIEAALKVQRVLATRKPVCWIVGFGDSSVDYVLRFWIRDPRAGLMNVKGQVYMALWDAFQEHGISIPFPQREVRMITPALDPPEGVGGQGNPGEDPPASAALREGAAAIPEAGSGNTQA